MTIAHDEAGTFFWTRTISDLVLRLEASKLSPSDRTGLHAKVVILLNDTQLAFSRFNVERDEDRVRLVNSAYKHLESDGPLKKAYPKEYLKNDLDTFCSGLEAALTDTIDVEMLAGAAERKPPVFMVWPYILEGGGTILFGPPGRGKSYTLLLMAVSMDAGIRDVFNVPKPRRVLVVNLERSAESQRLRLGNVNATMGLPRDRPLLFLNARGRSLADVSERVRKAIREHKVDAIFLDSISRAGMGDLNENAPVNRITDMLNGLCPTWFALAHTPRGDDTHVYGSVHFDAAADIMVQLVSQVERQRLELGIGLEVVKVNDLLLPDMQVLALRFNAEGLGLDCVRQASKQEFNELSPSQKNKSNAEVCRDYIEKHGRGCATDIADATGRNRANISTTLANDPQFLPEGKEGNKAYYVLAPDTKPSVAGNTQGNTGNRADNRDRHVLPVAPLKREGNTTHQSGDSGFPPHPPSGDEDANGTAGAHVNGAVRLLPSVALRAGQQTPAREEEVTDEPW